MYKKRFAAGFMTLMMLSLLPAPASAHCGGHRRAAAAPVSTDCAVCSVENCTLTGRHTHDGITYCGFAHADGICDGTCYALCAEGSCTLSGRHSHDGVIYCGSSHENGFCDGSCQASVVYGHSHHRHC